MLPIARKKSYTQFLKSAAHYWFYDRSLQTHGNLNMCLITCKFSKNAWGTSVGFLPLAVKLLEFELLVVLSFYLEKYFWGEINKQLLNVSVNEVKNWEIKQNRRMENFLLPVKIW